MAGRVAGAHDRLGGESGARRIRLRGADRQINRGAITPEPGEQMGERALREGREAQGWLGA
jgi:hypothetical protein